MARKRLGGPWRGAEVDNSKGRLDATGLGYPLIMWKGWKIEGWAAEKLSALAGLSQSKSWMLTNGHPNN